MIEYGGDPPRRACAHLRRMAESVIGPIERAVTHTGWIDGVIGRQGQPAVTWRETLDRVKAAFQRFEAAQRRGPH